MNDVKIKLLLDGQAQVITGIEGVNQKLAGVGRGAQVSAQASETLAAALARVGHYGIAGGALYGVAQSALSMGRALLEASASAQRLTTQLNFATGGRGVQELAFTADVAQRLGLNMKSTAQAYAGFASAARGTALEGAGARQVFEGIAKASAVMGLSADQTTGALLAVQQMMSKGVVSAEEFRGQLGERMPIALQAGAQALGVTTAEFSKMLESGQIVAQDFLPKFSRAITEMLGDSVEQAANRLDASVARMGNAWERLKQTVGDSGVSKAVANEATGISQYLDSVSDAMKRAEKAGSGTLMQLSAGLGQIIARAPFDVLAGAASLLNGTINTLSGGAARLNTSINLLPDALKTTAQQALALESNLKTAKSELAALQRQAETQGQSIYLKSEMHQLALYIQKLEEAKKKQANLSGAGQGRGTVNPPTVGAMLEQQQRDAEAANALRLKLAGVPDGYLKDMQEIIRLNVAGALTGKDYTDALKKQQETLLKKTGAAQGAAKAHRDTANAYESEQTAAKSWEKAMEDAQRLTSAATAKADGLSEAQRTLRDYLASSAYTVNEKTNPAMNAMAVADLKAAIAAEQHAAAQKTAADAARDARKAYEDQITTLQRSAATVQQQVERLQDEEQAAALAAAQHISLAQAVELVAIARLQEQQAGLLGNEAAVLTVQKEIDARRELLGLIAAKDARTAGEKAARDTADAWQKTADSIYNGLTDSLYRAFESGKGFFQTLWDGIKNTFKTTVLKLAVQGVMGGVAGALGLGSAAANAGGGGFMSSAAGSAAGSYGAGLIGAGSTLGGFGLGAANVAVGQLAGLTSAEAVAAATAAGQAAGAGAAAGMGAQMGALLTNPWTIGIGALLALVSSLDDSGTFHTGGAGKYSAANGSAVIDATTLGTADVVSATATEQAATTTAQVIASLLDSTALAFGKTAGYEAATAFADDSSKDGAWGALVINKLGEQIVNWQDTQTSRWAPKEFADGEAGQKQYTAALAASVRDAIDQIGLPAWAQTMLDSLGESTTMESLASVMEAINATHTALSQMGDALTGFASLSDAAKSKLIAASGGVAALATNAATYYDAYYSAEEKKAVLTQQVTDALNAVNVALPATADLSRDWLRAEVEKAQGLGEAGMATVAALMAVSGAFAQLTPAADAAAAALTQDQLQANMLKAGADVRAVLRGISDTVSAFAQTAAQAQQNVAAVRGEISAGYFAAQDAMEAAQQRVNDLLLQSADAMRRFAATLDDFVATLAPQAGAGASLQSLKSQLSASAVLAQGGDASAQARLLGEARAVLKTAEAGSTSRADYARSEAFVRNLLTGVSEAARQQADATAGTETAVPADMEVAQAALLAAQQQVVDYAALAAVTGASTDRAATQTAGSTAALLTAFEQAHAEDVLAQANYTSALAMTQGLLLTSQGNLDGLVAQLLSLGTAQDAQAAAVLALTQANEAAGVATGNAVDALAALDASLGLTGEAALAFNLLLAKSGLSADDFTQVLRATGLPAQALMDALRLSSQAADGTSGSLAELDGLLGLSGTAASAFNAQLLDSGLSAAAFTQIMAATGLSGAALSAALWGSAGTAETATQALEAAFGAAGLSSVDLAGLMDGTGLSAVALAGLLEATGGSAVALMARLDGFDAALSESSGMTAAQLEAFRATLQSSGLSGDVLTGALGLTSTAAGALVTVFDSTQAGAVSLTAQFEAAATAAEHFARMAGSVATLNASADPVTAAYQVAFGRNPEAEGAAYYASTGLSGQALLQAVLSGATGADVQAKALRGFAVGTSYVPYDMTAQIHAGEEITPRPYVDAQAADRAQTNTLLARLVASNAELLRSNAELKNEVALMRRATQNTDKTLTNVTRGGNAMLTETA